MNLPMNAIMAFVVGSDMTVVTVVVTITYWGVDKATVVAVNRPLVDDSGRCIRLINGVAKACRRSVDTTSGTPSDADAATPFDDGIEYLPVFLEAISLGYSGGLVLVALGSLLLNDVERMNIFLGR